MNERKQHITNDLKKKLIPLKSKQTSLHAESNRYSQLVNASQKEQATLQEKLTEVKKDHQIIRRTLEKISSSDTTSVYDLYTDPLSRSNIDAQILSDLPKEEKEISKKIDHCKTKTQQYNALAQSLKNNADQLSALINKFEQLMDQDHLDTNDGLKQCLKEMEQAVIEHKSILATPRPRSDLIKSLEVITKFFAEPKTTTMKMVEAFLDEAKKIILSKSDMTPQINEGCELSVLSTSDEIEPQKAS